MKFSDNQFCGVQEKVGKLVNRLNRYCYGSQYSKRLCKLDSVSALEICETGRLHSHLICLHTNNCNRTAQQIDSFIRKEWKSVLGIERLGSNFVMVEEFDMTRHWHQYITKDVGMIRNYNGHASIVTH